jgi:hypothetical protein
MNDEPRECEVNCVEGHGGRVMLCRIDGNYRSFYCCVHAVVRYLMAGVPISRFEVEKK